jgi:hypothetical protein
MKINVPPSTKGGTIDESPDLGQERHPHQNGPGHRHHEPAADAGERNGADVLIVGDQRHASECGGDCGTKPVGRHRAADAPLAALDRQHSAKRERYAHRVDGGDQVIDEYGDQPRIRADFEKIVDANPRVLFPRLASD